MATTERTLDVSELGAKSKEELLGLASDVGLNDTTALANLHKEDLLSRLFQVVSARQGLVSSGILEIMDEGYGFLRQLNSYRASGDVYISQSQIRRFNLRTGDTVTGQVRPPHQARRGAFGSIAREAARGPQEAFGKASPYYSIS